MPNFKVIFTETYLHNVVVGANSYEEAAHKADLILSKDTASFCSKEPEWFLHSVEQDMLPKRSRKDLLCSV